MSYVTTASKEQLALVVEVGSGSVGISIVHLIPDTAPHVVWSYREYATIKATTEQPATKVIKTALLNCFLELDTTGRQFIPDHLSSKDIVNTHVHIHAPWVYTVTKSVTYSQEHSFPVTDELIAELTQAAKTDTEETLAKLPDLKSLVVLDGTPQAIIANGYQISTWHNTKARTLKVYLLTTLTHHVLADMIHEMHEKTVARTHLTIRSHTVAVHSCMLHLHSEITEYCIVTVTTEATEIGIVRNGILQHVTSIPTGVYTLAREIAAAVQVPTEESHSYLKQSYTKLNENKKIQAVIASYEAQLAELFSQTGDALSIPTSLYVHTDWTVHELLLHIISEAATTSTKLTHSVHYLTNEILGDKNEHDTSLLVAVQQAATQAT